MNTTRNLLNSSIARTSFTAIYAVIAFFFMPFLVAHLGERWYGIWIVVTGLVANSYLLDLGISTAVTRYVAKYLAEKDDRGVNEVVNTCLVIYTALAAVIVVLTLVLTAFAGRFVPDATDLTIVRSTMILIGLQYAAEFPFKAFAGIVSSYVRYDLLMLSRLLNVVLSTGLMVFFIRRGHGIVTMAIIVLSVDQLSNFIYFRIAKHLFKNLRISRRFVKRPLVKELFNYSTWSFVIQLASTARLRVDPLVIGWMISATAVTFYSVGLRLVEYLMEFIQKATNMMTPVFTRYFFEGRFDEIRNKYLFVTRINAALAIFGGGSLIIFGKAFILRWMGPSFEESYAVLVVMTVAMTFEVIGVHADNILYAMSKHRFLAIVGAIEAIANVGLSILLARQFGIVGVAIGTAVPLLICRIFIIPYYVGQAMQLSMWRYYKDLAPLSLFTVLYLGVTGYLVRPFLEPPTFTAIALAGLVSVPLYVFAIARIGFTVEERAQLQNALPARIQRFSGPVLGCRVSGE